MTGAIDAVVSYCVVIIKDRYMAESEDVTSVDVLAKDKYSFYQAAISGVKAGS